MATMDLATVVLSTGTYLGRLTSRRHQYELLVAVVSDYMMSLVPEYGKPHSHDRYFFLHTFLFMMDDYKCRTF